MVTGRTGIFVALARHCEALGYFRYWMAEHHNPQAEPALPRKS